jgi:fatty acid desaturase
MPSPLQDLMASGRRHAPPELAALMRRRPWRVLLDAARCWGLIVGAFVALAAHPTWWVALLAFVVIGTQQYALSVLAHDGRHRNLFAQRTVNDLFSVVLLQAPVGVDFHRHQALHLKHHRVLGAENDPDLRLYAASDKAERRSFLLYLSGLTTLPMIADDDDAAATRSSRWVAVPAQLLVVAGICAVLPWWCWLTHWVAPLYLLMFVPHRMRQFCEHAQPVVPDRLATEERLLTYRPPWPERVLLAPFHIGYHAEHHLWPAVPYFNLPRLARALPSPPPFEVRGSYLGFLWRYFRGLPLIPEWSGAGAP